MENCIWGKWEGNLSNVSEGMTFHSNFLKFGVFLLLLVVFLFCQNHFFVSFFFSRKTWKLVFVCSPLTKASAELSSKCNPRVSLHVTFLNISLICCEWWVFRNSNVMFKSYWSRKCLLNTANCGFLWLGSSVGGLTSGSQHGLCSVNDLHHTYTLKSKKRLAFKILIRLYKHAQVRQRSW